MVEKKETAGKEVEKKAPEHKKDSKESVRKLIEEKMETIRKHDLAEEQPAAEKAKYGEKESGKVHLQAPAPKQKPLSQSVFVTGKRKRAVARGFFRQGKGVIKVNSIPIELVQPEVLRLRMMEPLIILGEKWKKFDGKVTARGGGPQGQADAVRQVIARAFSELIGPEARKAFLSYDRNLIVYDPRRTEPHKPPHSSWGPRRYKQRSKR